MSKITLDIVKSQIRETDESSMTSTDQTRRSAIWGRPKGHMPFKVDTREGYIMEMNLLKRVVEGRTKLYCVAPELIDEVKYEPDYIAHRLYICVTRNQDVHIWPYAIVPPMGDDDQFALANEEGLRFAKTQWTRMAFDRIKQKSDVFTCSQLDMEARWPEKSVEELVFEALAGAKAIISEVDHPMLLDTKKEL